MSELVGAAVATSTAAATVKAEDTAAALIFALIVIFIFGSATFNQLRWKDAALQQDPFLGKLTPRDLTDRNFTQAKAVYLLGLTLVFLVLFFVPAATFNGIDKTIAGMSPTTYIIALALALVGVVPNIPFLSRVEEEWRSLVHASVSIPDALLTTADDLRRLAFDAPPGRAYVFPGQDGGAIEDAERIVERYRRCDFFASRLAAIAENPAYSAYFSSRVVDPGNPFVRALAKDWRNLEARCEIWIGQAQAGAYGSDAERADLLADLDDVVRRGGQLLAAAVVRRPPGVSRGLALERAGFDVADAPELLAFGAARERAIRAFLVALLAPPVVTIVYGYSRGALESAYGSANFLGFPDVRSSTFIGDVMFTSLAFVLLTTIPFTAALWYRRTLQETGRWSLRLRADALAESGVRTRRQVKEAVRINELRHYMAIFALTLFVVLFCMLVNRSIGWIKYEGVSVASLNEIIKALALQEWALTALFYSGVVTLAIYVCVEKVVKTSWLAYGVCYCVVLAYMANFSVYSQHGGEAGAQTEIAMAYASILLNVLYLAILLGVLGLGRWREASDDARGRNAPLEAAPAPLAIEAPAAAPGDLRRAP